MKGAAIHLVSPPTKADRLKLRAYSTANAEIEKPLSPLAELHA